MKAYIKKVVKNGKSYNIWWYWFQKFHQHKGPISIRNIDINRIVVSNKVYFGKKRFKYFIGYKDAINIRPLCTFFPKMSTYRKDFDETKYIF